MRTLAGWSDGAIVRLTDDQQAKGSGAVSNVVASEPIGRAECAARDLKIMNSINEHGEAQDLPAADIAAAFFTLLTARQACSSGDFHGAIAIYDSVALGPGRPRPPTTSMASR